MKRNIFLDVTIIGIVIINVILAFYLPTPKAKLFLSLTSAGLLVLIMRGRVSNRILNPISILLLLAFLYVIFIFKR